MNHQNRTELAWYLLYYTYGFFYIIVGVDKFFHYLVDWNIYLNPAIPFALGVTPGLLMKLMGFVDIGTGLLIFYRPRWGGYVACIGLIAIIVNLISLRNYYDIAARDFVLAVGAIVLSLLSSNRHSSPHASSERH